MSLARLHEPAIKALIAVLPPAANVFNPVDMLASASPDTYAACLHILLADDNVEAVLVILPPPPLYKAEAVAERLIEIIAAGDGGLRNGKIMESDSLLSVRGKPLDSPKEEACCGGSAGIDFDRRGAFLLRTLHIPTYPFPERAASALGALGKTCRIPHHGDTETRRFNRVSVAPCLRG